MKEESFRITKLDIRIMVSIAVCYFTATLLSHSGILFSYGEMHIEIIQKMTSCISCLLVCQDNVPDSAKAGKNRLIITAIGGLVGVLVSLLDTGFSNEWLMVALVAVGALLTLFLCKVARVPYINARIGGITLILVSSTLSGNARTYYAIFRFISTLYGVVVVLMVTWLFQFLAKSKNGGEIENESGFEGKAV